MEDRGSMNVEEFAKNLKACDPEKKASYKCLDDNGYEREKCKEFFDAYNDCRKRWQRARQIYFKKKREQEQGGPSFFDKFFGNNSK
eukprot:m.41023 g.41023  ORF g.41023 m.41023 type:complete len:86 (+) comp6971_c1_seq2:349-606(+)